MTFQNVRPCSDKEVILTFLGFESAKPHGDHFDRLLREVAGLPIEIIRARVRAFGEQHNNGSPLFPYTVGHFNDERFRSTQRWVRATVELARIYSCGINPVTMQEHLQMVRGNLLAFTRQFAGQHPEFRLRGPPPPEALRLIIGIARCNDGKDGDVELIDGAHRAISLLHHGITSCEGVIAQLK